MDDGLLLHFSKSSLCWIIVLLTLFKQQSLLDHSLDIHSIENAICGITALTYTLESAVCGIIARPSQENPALKSLESPSQAPNQPSAK